MTPEQIAMLQKTLGVEPTGVMDTKTLAAFQSAYDKGRTKAGLDAHAFREASADLQRKGRAVMPGGVEVTSVDDMPPSPQVSASDGVEVEKVPDELADLDPDILGFYETSKRPTPPAGGIPGMMERMEPRRRKALLEKLSGVKR